MSTILWVKLKGLKTGIVYILLFTAMTLFLLGLFSYTNSNGGRPVVYIVDRQKSEFSSSLMERLEKNLIAFDIVKGEYEEAVDKLENYKAIAIILIEDEISTICVNKSTEYYNLVQLLNKDVTTVYRMQGVSESLTALLKSQDVVVNEKVIADINGKVNGSFANKVYTTVSKFLNVNKGSSDYNTKHFLIGFTIYMSMYSMFYGGIGDLLEDKRLNVLKRELVSPLSNFDILAGNILYTYIVGIIQIFILVFAGQYVFKIDWGGNEAVVFLVLAVFTFTATCLGYMLTTFARDVQQFGALSPVIITGTAMLGGCMWPLEIIDNKVLLFIAKLTPQMWGVDGIEKVVISGMDASTVIKPVIVLIGMGVVYLIIGSRRVNLAE